MTPPDLDLVQLEALAKAATPRPWRRDRFSMAKEGAGSQRTAKCLWTVSSYDAQGQSDFDFIAALCESADALLARVKAAEAERDTALTDSHDRIAELSDDLQATERLHAGYVAANLKATDAAKAAGIAEGLERAAKIADDDEGHITWAGTDKNVYIRQGTAKDIAAAIRADIKP